MFKDTDDEQFRPTTFKSEFNRKSLFPRVSLVQDIFAVITIDRTKPGPKRYYKFSFVVKDGGSVTEPHVPSPAVFEKSGIFHDFLITKMINAERATLSGPSFRGNLMNVKAQQMSLIIDEFIKK